MPFKTDDVSLFMGYPNTNHNLNPYHNPDCKFPDASVPLNAGIAGL